MGDDDAPRSQVGRPERTRAATASRAGRGAVVAALVALVALALPAGAATAPVTPYSPAADACFVDASHVVFLARDATLAELQEWVAAFAAGTPRYRLPEELANSDEWLSVEVTKLYQQALDRDPEPAGLAYWVAYLRSGALVNRIASLIYGSGEFYANAGSTTDGFLTDLYVRILHRAPDAAGLEYWRAQMAVRNRARIAELFFASIESRTDRVTSLYRQILGRAPDAPGLAYWTEQLITVNDVRLAVQLASGGEFYDRAQVGCDATLPATVTFTGHGWGHGRGMGQWGARGYAVDLGWSSAQILAHYYGGTTAATLTSTGDQRVYLTASKDADLVVTQDAGELRVDGDGSDVEAVRIARLGAGSFRVWRGDGCAGPWTLVGDRAASEVTVRPRVAAGEDPDRMLQHCVSGLTRYYRGTLAAVDALSTIVTVNTVATEDLLRSVVPKEMPASWADLGSGAGAAALQAQAVAARSYVMAGDTRWGSWATTCDSTACQVYAGYGTRVTDGTSIVRAEDARSDAAVAATAGQVRRSADSTVARTEFSSSTGGWTAGGTFPAVEDLGDATAANPYHSWTQVIDRSALEAAFDTRQGRDMGTFLGFDSYVRDGNGDLGGRVLSVRVRFTGGDVTLSGEAVRSTLGLKSSWFSA